MELGFVSTSDVKRYAENSLPERRHKAIEQTLLDDERARQLVIEKTGADNIPSPSAITAEKLALSVDACQKCLVRYEMIAAGDGTAPLQAFAADRFVKRWSLLQTIRQLLVEDAGASNAIGEFQENAGEPHAIGDLDVDQIIHNDSILAARLRAAFDAASVPFWKARLAGWIATIDNDIFRLGRLKRLLH